MSKRRISWLRLTRTVKTAQVGPTRRALFSLQVYSKLVKSSQQDASKVLGLEGAGGKNQ